MSTFEEILWTLEILTNIFYFALFILCMLIIGMIWNLGLEAMIEIIKRMFGKKIETKSEIKANFPLTSDLEDFAAKKLSQVKEIIRRLKKNNADLDITTMISLLKDLEELHTKGVISLAEFEKLKADILKV